MAESSQGTRLRVYITDENTPSTVGATQIKPPNPKPVRVQVPHLESTKIDKLTIPVVDQGEMTADFFALKADATHVQLRRDMVARPAPSRKWDLVHVAVDPDTEVESVTVLDTFHATLIDFPRTFQERQPIKGSLTLDIDDIPEVNPE